MSAAEDEAKYPGQISGIPPSPTRENPGAVFPKNDPKKAATPTPPRSTPPENYLGNPYLMRGALDKVDRAIGHMISILQGEEISQGGSREENVLLQKFKGWRSELDLIRFGNLSPPVPSNIGPTEPAQEGGMFID